MYPVVAILPFADNGLAAERKLEVYCFLAVAILPFADNGLADKEAKNKYLADRVAILPFADNGLAAERELLLLINEKVSQSSLSQIMV